MRAVGKKGEQTGIKVFLRVHFVLFLYFGVTFCSPAVPMAGYCQVFLNKDLVSKIATLCLLACSIFCYISPMINYYQLQPS